MMMFLLECVKVPSDLRVFALAVPSAWNALPSQVFAWLIVLFLGVSAHIAHLLRGLSDLS